MGYFYSAVPLHFCVQARQWRTYPTTAGPLPPMPPHTLFLLLVDTPPDLGNDAHYGIIMMYLHTSITASLYPIYYYPHLLCLCLH